VAQLENGNKQVYLTDAKAAVRNQTATQPQYKPKYITDSESSSYSSKEIYFRWLSRLVVLCAVISLSFFLSSTLVIFRLAPEIIVEPLLIINQNDSDTMVRYEPITTKMPSLRQFTEMYVKQYVILRNTVINDLDEMRTRWGPGGLVHYYSAPDIYSSFVGKNSRSVNKMFDNDYSSEVRIDTIGKVSENSPAWEVTFTVYNLSRTHQGKDGALVLKTIRYKASVTPKYYRDRAVVYPRLINPLGFTVIKYSQDEIRE
jgi:type IV secretory pathway component VirB8